MSEHEIAVNIVTDVYIGTQKNAEFQQRAADTFCNLIEFNETEFNKLGLTFKNS